MPTFAIFDLAARLAARASLAARSRKEHSDKVMVISKTGPITAERDLAPLIFLADRISGESQDPMHELRFTFTEAGVRWVIGVAREEESADIAYLTILANLPDPFGESHNH